MENAGSPLPEWGASEVRMDEDAGGVDDGLQPGGGEGAESASDFLLNGFAISPFAPGKALTPLGLGLFHEAGDKRSRQAHAACQRLSEFLDGGELAEIGHGGWGWDRGQEC